MQTYTKFETTTESITAVIAIPFKFLTASSIVIEVNGASLTQGTDYTINGPVVTFTPPISEGSVLTIERHSTKSYDNFKNKINKDSLLSKNTVERAIEDIVFPVQERTSRFGASIGEDALSVEANLSDVFNPTQAVLNLGSIPKSLFESTVDSSLLSRANNLSDVPSPSIARDNLSIYSRPEIESAVQSAVNAALASIGNGQRIIYGSNIPRRMPVCLYLDANNNKGVVLLPRGANYVWCNNYIRTFYGITKDLSYLSSNVVVHLYLRVDEDGGYYLDALEDTPLYDESYVTRFPYRTISDAMCPYVGSVYTGPNFTSNGIFDIVSMYNRVSRKRIPGYSFLVLPGDQYDLQIQVGQISSTKTNNRVYGDYDGFNTYYATATIDQEIECNTVLTGIDGGAGTAVVNNNYFLYKGAQFEDGYSGGCSVLLPRMRDDWESNYIQPSLTSIDATRTSPDVTTATAITALPYISSTSIPGYQTYLSGLQRNEITIQNPIQANVTAIYRFKDVNKQ